MVDCFQISLCSADNRQATPFSVYGGKNRTLTRQMALKEGAWDDAVFFISSSAQSKCKWPCDPGSAT